MGVHACANGCGNFIQLGDAQESRLRQTHDTFYCPLGHRNCFPGKTEQEREIESLKKRLTWYEKMLEEEYDRYREDCYTCQWPGCRDQESLGSEQALRRHMIKQHGMPTVKEYHASQRDNVRHLRVAQ